jgi:hypothetical protein
MLVVHASDEVIVRTLGGRTLQVHCANILMKNQEDRAALAEAALSSARRSLSFAGVPAR